MAHKYNVIEKRFDAFGNICCVVEDTESDKIKWECKDIPYIEKIPCTDKPTNIVFQINDAYNDTGDSLSASAWAKEDNDSGIIEGFWGRDKEITYTVYYKEEGSPTSYESVEEFLNQEGVFTDTIYKPVDSNSTQYHVLPDTEKTSENRYFTAVCSMVDPCDETKLIYSNLSYATVEAAGAGGP